MIAETALNLLLLEEKDSAMKPDQRGFLDTESMVYCVRQIRSYVESQPERVRRELARRTNWCFGAERKGENRCLIAQVADIRARLGLPQEVCPTVYNEFDLLAGAIGLLPVVALVQDSCDALK